MITGDYLKNVPLPHARRWPDSPDRCTVSVTTGVYRAIGHHYHVNIKEEHNPIWDSRDAEKWGKPGEPMGWRECWDDTAGRGMIFREVFDLRCQANDYIEAIVAEHFPPETHCVYINAENMDEYFYRWNGD